MPQDPTYRPTDVRMKGFARRWTVQDCLAWIEQQTPASVTETVALADANARVLGSDITSNVSVPHFARAMMDGFAVFASDTSGATTYNSQSLKVIGQSLPGNPFDGEISHGHCIRIMTGAPMPSDADAVLPVEHTVIHHDTIVIQGEVAPGKHVGLPGEDIRSGTTVLQQGRQLRPQDLGVLSSIGASEVKVVKRPRVRLIITGNELLPPGSTPNDFNITDANSPMLSALIARDGGKVIHPGIIPDNPSSILEAFKADAEIILVSGGSSVGQEDHAPRLLAEHGSLDIHGVAMRPSSPSGMGTFDNKLVFLLPGNPVSCLCAYDFFAARAVRKLAGRPAQWPHRVLTLPLARKLVSMVGRTDYARVSIQDGMVEPIAISGASVLSSTTRADGFVIIAEDLEGFPRGAEVTVYLYE